MFKTIWNWIVDWINKMLGKQNIKQALNVDIAINSDMADKLELWTEIYENNAPWVSFNVNGKKKPNDVYSLGLGMGISGEIARTVTIEMKADVTGSARADFLNEQLARVVEKMRHQTEFGCAKGGLVMKPYVDGDKIAIDFVQADEFYPVSFDSDGDITAAVFIDRKKIKNHWYSRLEYHSMTDEGCEIVNKAYKSSTESDLGNEVPLTSVDAWADILPEATIRNIERPLFAYFRFPKANNIDPDSPLGVSCYSGAEDLIRQADYQWSRLLWEMEAGEFALYVDEAALRVDSDGKFELPNKRLHRATPSGNPIGEGKLYQEWAPTLREQSLLNGLDAILRRVEFQCGLAYGTLSNPQTVDKTATELKIAKQRSAATITDTQKALEKALNVLLYAMDVWATLGNLSPRGAYEASFEWDDSIVVDADTQRQQDMQEQSRGIMSKLEYRMRNHGETKDQAREMLKLVDEEREPMFEIPGEE